ncbi:response regulator [Methylobacter sp. S3L5C]|uniref:response regulator n=1 Tax=Methylobacter sp. S3L5C TaxID=2839024 RepID=UPI001FAC7D4D|nr:response regulator [Methylobacter sp. S3L5C]UOA08211.1 response regulator [Methylobacter sp. S3L5C]
MNDFNKQLVGLHILVAEDNLFNQKIIQKFLNLLGINVEFANNGKEALALLEMVKFDAVLMDINMPVMDGITATQQLRSQPRFAKLPIIALTAAVSEAERDQYMAAGMNDMISKPINPTLLTSALVRWIKFRGVMATDSDIVPESIETVEQEPPIKELPYFDKTALLVMLGNNQDLTDRLLVDFKEDMQNFPAEIAAMITVKDISSIWAHIHSLKGVAGNLGALQLHAAAILLQTQLKEGLPTAAMVNDFNAVFVKTMSKITLPPQPAIVSPQNTGNSEIVRHCINELDALLREHDFIPEILLNNLMENLATVKFKLFIRLRKLIYDLHYQDARLLLQQLVVLPDIQETL